MSTASGSKLQLFATLTLLSALALQRKPYQTDSLCEWYRLPTDVVGRWRKNVDHLLCGSTLPDSRISRASGSLGPCLSEHKQSPLRSKTPRMRGCQECPVPEQSEMAEDSLREILRLSLPHPGPLPLQQNRR